MSPHSMSGKVSSKFSILIFIICALLVFSSSLYAQMTDEELEILKQRAIDEGWTFEVGRNPATEIPHEYLAGAVRPVDYLKDVKMNPIATKADLPEAFSWLDSTGLPPIKNQGSCGSCWAFACMGVMESSIYIKDEDIVDLSEQWAVSCNTYGYSCDGGWLIYEYFVDSPDLCGQIGAVPEWAYPYQGEDLPCNCPYQRDYYIESWSYVTSTPWIVDYEALKAAIMLYGPISTVVYSDGAFSAYNGGIYNIDDDPGYIDHVVDLVGWDDNQGTNGVWILRNSWGTGWGESGYMRIEYGVNLIGTDAAYIVYNGRQRIDFGDNLFSETAGDGDGYYEAGETIDISIEIENKGPELVTNVSCELAIEDESITITDGSSWIGGIAGSSSAWTTSDPFTIDIPIDYAPRLDTFKIIATWNCGAGIDTVGVDTFYIEKILGQPEILIVDDDEGENYERFLEGDFTKLRIPTDRWDISDSGSPVVTDFDPYSLVIWFTGDYRSDPLTIGEAVTMQSWMDGGGNLFLTGQSIAPQLTTFYETFLNDYLHCEYVSSAYMPILFGLPGGQVISDADTIAIMGASGAGNQSNQDFINAINGGVPELQIYGNPEYGAVSYLGDYKCLFFAFGYEGILQTHSSFTARDSILIDILDFFDYSQPMGAPLAYDLEISPGDTAHMVDHIPDFSWIYFDFGGLPQTQYQLQVDDNVDWDVVGMWDTGPVSGTATGLTYAGLTLEDGVTYRIRLRVHNGTLWSGWKTSQFHMNSVPTTPEELSPSDMEILFEEPIVLSHEISMDNESDTRTYDYELYADAGLTTLLAYAYNEPGDVGMISSWTVPISLDNNEDYYWRVRAFDGYEYGEWAGPEGFILQSSNHPPNAFGLLEPDNGSALTNILTPAFCWSLATDSDAGDVVTYNLYLKDGYSAPPIDSLTGLVDTTCIWYEDLELEVVYYWNVVAKDQLGATTSSTNVFNFMLSFLCGDANGDESVNIADAAYIINAIFFGGNMPDPEEAADANEDGNMNIVDASYIINWIFFGGNAPCEND